MSDQPDTRPVLFVPVPFKLTLDPNKNSGSLHMGFAAVSAEIVQTDNESQEKITLGEIMGNLGGSFTVRDKVTREHWTAYPMAMWEAYAAARADVENARARLDDQLAARIRLLRLEALEKAVMGMVDMSSESTYGDERAIMLSDFHGICEALIQLGHDGYMEYVPSYNEVEEEGGEDE